MTFKQWIQRVDSIVRMLIGRSIYDLTDRVLFCDLCQWHADGITAKDVADRIINSEGEA